VQIENRMSPWNREREMEQRREEGEKRRTAAEQRSGREAGEAADFPEGPVVEDDDF
jgi:hypothetical protein